MYSRSYSNGGRYNPPPGYVGSTFSEPEVKLHSAADDGEMQNGHTGAVIQRSPAERAPVKNEGTAALDELIRSLRGKIGTEELIILLVMLLTASDGIGIETMILAAVLLAGRRESEN